MRKIILGILCCCNTLMYAQVWDGNLDFHSQQEIDDFGNSSYTTVRGLIYIDDSFDGVQDIRNLAGLAGLTAVGGNLTISRCNLLTNTSYLNITSAGGFQINDNAALTTINGLEVTLVTGDISITNNPQLTSITGFSKLAATSRVIAISNNPLLTDLSGFSNLETAGIINFTNNASLLNLDVFSKLKEASGLRLTNNAAMTGVDGLTSLKTLGTLALRENPALNNLDGLVNLTTVLNGVNLSKNPSLLDIDGLLNLTGRAAFVIQENNSLQTIKGGAGITNSNLLVVSNPALKSISGFANSEYATLDITDNVLLESISGFNNVQRAGSLTVQGNWVLKTMDIFPQVRNIVLFDLDRNYILEDISPMPLLDTVSANFSLVTDTMLTNLDFIPGLKFVGGTLRISSIEKLRSIDGLSNLDSVGGDFSIGLFYAPNIDALSKIKYISGKVEIGAGYEITNLKGLRNLKKVGGSFNIGGVYKVKNLFDLVNLESVEALIIQRIFQLTNINGLRNLRSAGSVYIIDNPLLSDFCGLYNLFTLNPPGFVQITGNQVNPTADNIRNGGTCAPLPVHWLAFNLLCADNKIQLNWLTSNEVNNSHFIVQRSSDGRSWADLELIAGAGNNGNVSKYFYTDNQPVDKAYYRLAQVDFDRKVHYSPVIRASCAAPVKYKIWPNPASDKVQVSIQSSNNTTGFVRLYDGKGSLARSKNIFLLAGQNQVELDISAIAKGTYFLHILWDENRQQQRTILVKK